MFYGPVWVLRLPFLPPGEGGVLGDPKIASLFVGGGFLFGVSENLRMHREGGRGRNISDMSSGVWES